MGIIVRDENTGQVIFYLKGADVVMKLVVQYNDWLEEEVIYLVDFSMLYLKAWIIFVVARSNDFSCFIA